MADLNAAIASAYDELTLRQVRPRTTSRPRSRRCAGRASATLTLWPCRPLRLRRARQAYTQRAMVYRVKGDDDQAFLDFDAAAALGSEVAKAEAAKVNPYAKMCNAMLSEVLKSYRDAWGVPALNGDGGSCSK